ncbi:MAG: DNA-binding protein [Verrucomicrobia bacterium]|nr:DNA-binding protein [Verrucomicrobiota bacterium]
MAESEPAAVVLDAGPIIHLDELGCLDLLDGFGELRTPHTVWQEVQRHRPQMLPGRLTELKLSDVSKSPSPTLTALVRGLDLDAGEIAALCLLEQTRGELFLCDDAAARLAAESIGFKVHGTIGLIVRAIRRSTRTVAQVKGILEQIPSQSTLHISRSLLAEIIRLLPKH